MLSAVENFAAKIPLDATCYVKLTMVIEILANRLVRDACRPMYRVPLLFPVFATQHDDFETTPETQTGREQKKQFIKVYGKKNNTIFNKINFIDFIAFPIHSDSFS